MHAPNKNTEHERILRIAYEALNECNQLHDLTGRDKIPLDEVAENLAISKEEIQESFDKLVEEGVIGDDNDRDHMNYSGELLDLILQLLLEFLRTKKETEQKEKEEEKEEEITPYI